MNVDTMLAEMKTALAVTYTTTEIHDYIPERIVAPALVLALTEGDYQETLGDSVSVTVDVVLLLNRGYEGGRDASMPSFSAVVDPSASTSVPRVLDDYASYTQGVSVQTQGFTRGTVEIGGTVYDAITFTVECID